MDLYKTQYVKSGWMDGFVWDGSLGWVKYGASYGANKPSIRDDDHYLIVNSTRSSPLHGASLKSTGSTTRPRTASVAMPSQQMLFGNSCMSNQPWLKRSNTVSTFGVSLKAENVGQNARQKVTENCLAMNQCMDVAALLHPQVIQHFRSTRSRGPLKVP